MIPLFSSLYASLLQFAVGSLFAALISETGGKVTPGFLRQAAVAALIGALLAWMMTGRGAFGEAESALALVRAGAPGRHRVRAGHRHLPLVRLRGGDALPDRHHRCRADLLPGVA